MNKLSLLTPHPPLQGMPITRFAPILNQKKRLGVGFAKKIALSLESSGEDVGNKLGVVRPAKQPYAQEAVDALKAGKVIAVPTDTIYGFACDACSLEAVNRIYEIKGRLLTRPLAICVGDVSDINRFSVIDHLPHGLLDSLLPGPVTVVLRRGESSVLEKSLNPGLDSIGVRVPDSNFIRVIAHGLGSAVALTSANLSGQPSSLCIKDFESLWKHCAYVYDGGVLPSGREGSTIVDLTAEGKYKILRPGRVAYVGNVSPSLAKLAGSCQVLLFSATFNETVKTFVSKTVSKDHNQVFVEKEELSLEAVKQYKVELPDELAKIAVIKDRILELGEKIGQIIIFVKTRKSAGMLHKSLMDFGYYVTTLHGALEHGDRDKIVKEFKDGLTKVLICTDVLARGFDQQQVNLVINYDLPVKHGTSDSDPDYEVYLHRIGRAGRFGRKGAVFNFIMHDWDREAMRKIENYFDTQVAEVPSWNKDQDFEAALKSAGLL
ncbi:hypothetical protein Tsubulata_007975 [Turnera subulata]|uniref:Threonylcarbamoyl-AMP synthase n=1 Tax=Turnera subulata TaxID=218843 RepID=A0A9Q0JI91_9ROSI|nr:hypothetical protein Tsubulata_007975 [Turnera subulata]